MACPTCGNKAVKIKGYVPKKITHSVLTNRSCQILYKARRYVCPVCGHTYYEENPFVFKKMKISIFTVKKILEDLHNFNETFTSVANRYNISPTSACSIFDQHIDIPRKPFPRYINFDEVYAFKSSHSKYVCVILDYMNQTPVDVLPSRREDFLKEYFDRIPKEERDQVKVCCFDMYKTYRTICRRYFKNAILVVDRFHVSQELHRRLNQIRIDVMKTVNRKKLRAQREKQYDRDAYKEYIKYDRQYYLLRKFNWLLLKDPDDEKIFDIFAEGKKNLKFDRTMNFYELREELLRIDPLLKEAYELKNVFSKFYKESVSTTAKRNLEEMIQLFSLSEHELMRGFSVTLSNWKEEIINSFNTIKTEYVIDNGTGQVEVRELKMNNAIIENKNSIIKCVKKNANGFTNWKRFRNRIMYVLNPDESELSYPKEAEKQ